MAPHPLHVTSSSWSCQSISLHLLQASTEALVSSCQASQLNLDDVEEEEAEAAFLFNPENKEVITVPAYRNLYLSIF
jgi:hypothetical protein